MCLREPSRDFAARVMGLNASDSVSCPLKSENQIHFPQVKPKNVEGESRGGPVLRDEVIDGAVGGGGNFFSFFFPA